MEETVLNNRVNNERKIWDRSAKYYDRNTKRFEKAYQLSVEKTLEFVNNESKILEVGCGTGIITFEVAGFVKEIEAIDLSEKMIQIAKEKQKQKGVNNINFQVGDAYDLEYPDKAFNVVLLFNTLHVFKSPENVIKEIHRILKQKGILITATDCYAEKTSFKTSLMHMLEKLAKSLGIIKYLSFYKKEDLEVLIEGNGFQIKETKTLFHDPVNYLVLGEKL